MMEMEMASEEAMQVRAIIEASTSSDNESANEHRQRVWHRVFIARSDFVPGRKYTGLSIPNLRLDTEADGLPRSDPDASKYYILLST
jgi:hypothetical protein